MPDALGSVFDHLDPATVAAVEARLTEGNGSAWRRLDESDLITYQSRKFEGGWRLSIEFADGMKHIDVLITRWFPFSAARTALVEHPPRLTWPHVEDDGVLCLLSEAHEMDQDDPATVIENLLSRSCRLIEELLIGAIVDRDFREEFLTYWAYDLHRPRRHYSLLRPGGPSRAIRAWHGQGFTLVAEDDSNLKRWLENYSGVTKGAEFSPAALLWFDQGPVPVEYPQRAMHLVALARNAQGNGKEVLESTSAARQGPITVIIGAEGRGGAGLVAVTVEPFSSSPPGARSARRSNGFRKGMVPGSVLMERTFGPQKVARSLVHRADAGWVHGRGRDPRSQRLSSAKIVLFGCGSVGSFVAASFVHAGVGTLHIVDPDKLEWSNIGRHYLGGGSVGFNKATEFAERSRVDYPHLEVFGHEGYAETVIGDPPDWFSSADLIISVTGSGRIDKILNEWFKSNGRSIPVVYGWTEPFAGAGHAIAMIREGPCLTSSVNNLGMSLFEMVEWDRPATLEEPACGTHFTPYGPVELNHVNDLISQLALDCLLGKVTGPTHRIWAAREQHLDEFQGRWTEAGRDLLGDDTEGGRILTRRLPNCPCCC